MRKMKFGSQSGTGFIAPTKSVTQGTTGHSALLQKSAAQIAEDKRLASDVTSKTTKKSTQEFGDLTDADKKTYFDNQANLATIDASEGKTNASLISAGASATSAKTGAGTLELNKEKHEYTQKTDKENLDFKKLQQEEVERQGQVSTDIATQKSKEATAQIVKDDAQTAGTAEAQKIAKAEAEKQKKIMGGKYAQEAAEKKAIKTDYKVGERREALEESKVNIETRRIGRQTGKMEKSQKKINKWTKELEKYKDNPHKTKLINTYLADEKAKINRSEKKIIKIEDREEKGGIFKRMSTKIAENKADEAQRMLDPVYRQQKEARRNAKAADMFQSIVSPEAKRAGSYQQDLATAEMESARLKQQKEQNLKKDAIHLPDKKSVADIYKYDVGETEDS